MQETWVQSLGQEDLLEKETATHSSILAWKIPWMEEPGRLQSMGSGLENSMNRIAHGVTKSQTQLSNFHFTLFQGFPGGTSGKEPTCSAGDIKETGSIPGSWRSPEGRHGSPLQYSCLANPLDRGAWWTTVHSVAKSQIWLKKLSAHICIYFGKHETQKHNDHFYSFETSTE